MSEFNPEDSGPRPVRATKPSTDLVEVLGPSFDRRRAPDREGLPAGYRMRADAHYVEQLTASRSAEPPGDKPAAPAADTGELLAQLAADLDAVERRSTGAPPPAPVVDHTLLQAILQEVAAIQSASTLLPVTQATLAERVAIDLVKAQAWRAAWLIRAAMLLQVEAPVQTVRPGGTSVLAPLGSVLAKVIDGFAPEARLNGFDLRVSGPAWHLSAPASEDALSCGITGAIVATLGILDGRSGQSIVLAATASATAVSIHVSQYDVVLTEALRTRFFDRDWTTRPGGVAASMGALVVKAAAERHGGRAALVVHERAGSTIELQLPLVN